jgi:hypothetical protein
MVVLTIETQSDLRHRVYAFFEKIVV